MFFSHQYCYQRTTCISGCQLKKGNYLCVFQSSVLLSENMYIRMSVKKGKIFVCFSVVRVVVVELLVYQDVS